MNVNQLKESLGFFRKTPNIVPLFLGPHGIGKTESVEQFAKENNLALYTIRIGQYTDAGDLLGLQVILGKDGHVEKVITGDTNHLRCSFITPDIFPKSIPKGFDGVLLFLDEITMAHQDLIPPLFQLIEKRKYNNYELPENTFIVCAGNPPTEDYQGTVDFQNKAWIDRFCHIEVSHNDGVFLEYAKSKSMNSDLVGFLTEHPTFIREQSKEVFTLDYVKPSNRSQFKVNQVLNSDINESLQKEIISGLIGSSAMLMLFKYKEEKFNFLKAVDIFKKFDPSKYKKQTDAASGLTIDDILANIKEKSHTAKQLENVKTYLKLQNKEHITRFVINMLENGLYTLKEETFNTVFSDDEEFANLIKRVDQTEKKD